MSLLLALACAVDGEPTYRWLDADGAAHYTDDPSSIPAGAEVVAAPGAEVVAASDAEIVATPAAVGPGNSQVAPTVDAEPDALPPDAQLSEADLAAQQAAIAAQQGQVSSVRDFEAPLSAAGQWVDVDGYRAWQPSPAVVGSEFVPYQTNGHWAWTDAGWVFVSDFDWGWATFHYGRWWQSPQYGWLWYPDLAWGPAWVSWRLGGGYAGWAPLWPRHIRWHHHWSFVPNRWFGDPGFHRYARFDSFAYRSTALLPFASHGPSLWGVRRWGSPVTYGVLDRRGYGGSPSGSWGGYRPSPGYGGGFRPAPPPPSSGFGGGFRPAPPPPSSGFGGGFRPAPPPPSSGFGGGFRSAPPPPSSGFGGGFRSAPPPPSSGFGGWSGSGGFHGGGHRH